MKKLILFFAFLTYSFAIVSIEPREIGEKNPGLSGEVGFSAEINRGNTDTTSLSLSSRLQYDETNSLQYAIISYEYGESKGSRYEDRAYLHLRDLQKIDNSKVWEYYFQIQRDEFKDQNLRAILGTGPRIKIYNKKAKAYIGVGAFFEREEIKHQSSDNYFRGNFYIAYKEKFNENVKAALVSYYQPKLDEFSDYETFSTLEFSIKLSGRLNLLLKTIYNYDSRPASNVEKYDFTQKMGIIYKF